jgi:hypothetical protein
VTNVPRNPILSWHSPDLADTFNVQVSLSGAFSTLVVDTSVVDTFIQTNVLASGTRYFWHVRGVNQYGAGDFSSTANFVTGDQIVEVKEIELVPFDFILEQNFPNPFNPSTKINWQSQIGSWQSLKIYDLLGNELITLFEGYKPAGIYEIDFTAGNEWPSGVYFYRLICGDIIRTKKMLLAK